MAITELVKQITQLSTIATPGKRNRIAPKVPPVSHAGLFTELQVYVIPGQKHSFSAKGIIPVAPSVERIEVGAGGYRRYGKLDIKIPTEMKVAMEEEEILELIAILLRIL